MPRRMHLPRRWIISSNKRIRASEPFPQTYTESQRARLTLNALGSILRIWEFWAQDIIGLKVRGKMLTENQYQPLPNCLTIKESEIHGNGLFALSDIPIGTDLGESHYRCSESSEIKRTPLGGFINHSEDSNCKRVGGPSSFHIVTTSEIRAGDELTVTYTWYTPS